jgi:hypothetical protein
MSNLSERRQRAEPRHVCSGKSQTGRPCKRGVLVPGGRCPWHSGPISFPSGRAYLRTILVIVRTPILDGPTFARGPRALLRAIRRHAEDVLAGRRLRSWGDGEEDSAPRLTAPGVVESTARAHTDGGAGG